MTHASAKPSYSAAASGLGPSRTPGYRKMIDRENRSARTSFSSVWSRVSERIQQPKGRVFLACLVCTVIKSPLHGPASHQCERSDHTRLNGNIPGKRGSVVGTPSPRSNSANAHANNSSETSDSGTGQTLM